MGDTILIIEDDPSIRENLVELLSEEGFACITADNGRLGVESARRGLPGLILCDVSMPELDGLGVLRALRGEPALAAIPFLFLSARAEKSEVLAGKSLGADDYLTKPFTRRELLDAVHACLARGAQASRGLSPPAAPGTEGFEGKCPEGPEAAEGPEGPEAAGGTEAAGDPANAEAPALVEARPPAAGGASLPAASRAPAQPGDEARARPRSLLTSSPGTAGGASVWLVMLGVVVVIAVAALALR